MKRLLILTSAIAAAMASGVAGRLPSNFNAVDPLDQVWEEVIKAKGGHRRLQDVRTLAWAAESVGGRGARTHLQYVESYPDRYWSWEDYRPGALGFGVVVWNGQKRLHWVSDKGGPAKAIRWHADGELFQLSKRREHQIVFLLESAFLTPKVLSMTTTSGAAVIELGVQGFKRVILTIDAGTLLPSKIAFVPDLGPNDPPGKDITRTYSIEEYSDVGGLKMPTRIRDMGQLRFVLNPALDEKLFEDPPDRVMRGDDWKTYLKK